MSGSLPGSRPAAPSAAGRLALAVLLGIAAWHGGRFAWIEAKAELAQQLMRRAWRSSQDGGGEVRPWPWADTSPLARLEVPRLGVDQLVLAGASGRTLAFGPGHLSGTALPGAFGNAVISGHRDTHFAYLRRLRVGDRIVVERRDGRRRSYAVEGSRVVDRTEVAIAADTPDTRLTLVTCYPFDAVRPGGPLRYVVVARADQAEDRYTGGTSAVANGEAGSFRREEESMSARALLRHTVATLAYRGGKAVREAPAGFAGFKPGPTTRTPAEILAHVGDLFDWALSMALGEDYARAEIVAGRVGPEQAAPRREFD